MMSGEEPVSMTTHEEDLGEREVITNPDTTAETTSDTGAVNTDSSAEHIPAVTVEHEQSQPKYVEEQSQAINNLLDSVDSGSTPATDVNANKVTTVAVSVSAPSTDGSVDSSGHIHCVTDTKNVSTAINTDVKDTGTSTATETSEGNSTGLATCTDNTKSDSSIMTVSDSTVTTTKDSKEKGKEGKPRKRKRRGSAWSDEQTEFLMEIWARQAAEQKEEEVNPNTATPVYRIIAKAMQEQGDTKSWEQCKTRIHTLKRAYKTTKDEITTGAPNITYCRHFDKLEIIMHDNATTPPQSLADLLEARRKSRAENANRVKTPQKRKLLTVPNKFAKQNLQSPSYTSSSTAQQHMQSVVDRQQTNTTGTNDYWMNQSQTNSTYQQISPSPLTQQLEANSGSTMYTQSQTIPNVSPYSMTNSSVYSETLTPARMPEINNNDISVKTERQETSTPQTEHYSMSTMTAQTWTIAQPPQKKAQPQQKEELEKMRLNLELRKIEMERNKLEMAERQRREERDHQYRMLQLLLFGLGQQNSAHSQPGQGVEQVVAHAQKSTNLSRALENGLVPGGPHTANEKGLSFNEI